MCCKGGVSNPVGDVDGVVVFDEAVGTGFVVGVALDAASPCSSLPLSCQAEL